MFSTPKIFKNHFINCSIKLMRNLKFLETHYSCSAFQKTIQNLPVHSTTKISKNKEISDKIFIEKTV